MIETNRIAMETNQNETARRISVGISFFQSAFFELYFQFLFITLIFK